MVLKAVSTGKAGVCLRIFGRPWYRVSEPCFDHIILADIASSEESSEKPWYCGKTNLTVGDIMIW